MSRTLNGPDETGVSFLRLIYLKLKRFRRVSADPAPAAVPAQNAKPLS